MPSQSVQNADCRTGTKCRLGTQCKLRIYTGVTFRGIIARNSYDFEARIGDMREIYDAKHVRGMI